MKLSITHTCNPDGTVIVHENNAMAVPTVKNKGDVMKAAVFNEVRPGGVCYEEMSLLDQAYKILETA